MHVPGPENLFCLRNSEAHPTFRLVVADNGWLSLFFFVFFSSKFWNSPFRPVQADNGWLSRLRRTWGCCRGSRWRWSAGCTRNRGRSEQQIVLQISLNEKTKRSGVLTLCFIYCLIQRFQRPIASATNRLNFPKCDNKFVTNFIFSTAGALTMLTAQ